MIGALVLFAFQAQTPQPAVLATAAEAPVEETAAQPAATTTEPPRKKVCRSVLDTRTGMMGKRSKVCRYVDETPDGGK